MNVFLRRVYFFVAGILIVLWVGMFGWILQVLSPGLLSLVSAPKSQFSESLEDFTPILQVPGIRFFIYPILAGDTFSSVAQKFSLSEQTLRSLNQANDSTEPKVNTKLLIPSKDGIFHMAWPGQGLSDIARAYGIPLGEVLRANRKKGDTDLRPGEILYLPGGVYLTCQDIRWISLNALQSQNGFLKPTTGRFADGFGMRLHPVTHKMAFHAGLDLAPGWGARVVASQDGRVIFAGIRAGYGRLIILDHGKGLTSWYAHLDQILVKLQEWTKKGSLIGKVGKTGRVTGPHLHFEVRLNGKPQNPLLYLVQ